MLLKSNLILTNFASWLSQGWIVEPKIAFANRNWHTFTSWIAMITIDKCSISGLYIGIQLRIIETRLSWIQARELSQFVRTIRLRLNCSRYHASKFRTQRMADQMECFVTNTFIEPLDEQLGYEWCELRTETNISINRHQIECKKVVERDIQKVHMVVQRFRSIRCPSCSTWLVTSQVRTNYIRHVWR